MTTQDLIDGCEDFSCECGGEYCIRDYDPKQGGAITGWASRLFCDKCGNYMDVSGERITEPKIIEALDEYFRDPHNYSAEITRDDWWYIKRKLEARK